MEYFRKYPENRLDIRIDENGKVTYEENREFARYYAPTKEELKEELDELQHEFEMLRLDEPDDYWDGEHEIWEDEMSEMKNRIRELEEAIEEFK